jgi:uncharacterized protein YecE (DUF72 family)
MVDLKSIRIGTSGYSFLDWIGPFYPQGIQRGKMLDYYISHFDIVEVNSSFYRIPHPKVFENMEKKTPKHFEFIVKAHRSFTHDRTDIVSGVQEFKRSIEPLVQAGKLRGILLQFPYSFKWNPKNTAHLMRLLDELRVFSLYAEFRHRGWLRDEIFMLFEERRASICSVDGPQLAGLPKPELFDVSDRIYVRLHGRNAEQWWKGGALRYDYLYSEDQLKDWISRMRECRKSVQSALMFFNNCHRGQAVQNAKVMMELLRQDTGSEESK